MSKEYLLLLEISGKKKPEHHHLAPQAMNRNVNAHRGISRQAQTADVGICVHPFGEVGMKWMLVLIHKLLTGLAFTLSFLSENQTTKQTRRLEKCTPPGLERQAPDRQTHR